MIKKLGSILNTQGFSKKKSFKEPLYTSDEIFDFFELISHWEEIVGENLASHTIPLKNTRKELTVLSDHPIYSQQLSLMDQLIIKKIIKFFPQLNKQIKTIKFQTNTSFFKKVKEQNPI